MRYVLHACTAYSVLLTHTAQLLKRNIYTVTVTVVRAVRALHAHTQDKQRTGAQRCWQCEYV
jgi:hypothetical protein